jgi:8-oxo-dGTP pyrophosphatase MutT (NUDIX family)
VRLDELEARLSRVLRPLDEGRDERAPLPPGVRQAAVLVPILARDSPSILLTKRAETLPHHAGQVSFPGGGIDPADASAAAAALREAEEEIGLSPSAVALKGMLPDHHTTSSNFLITPVVGFIDPEAPLRPEPAEVAALLELPLALLLDPATPRRESAVFRGERREFWVIPHPEHLIWGATAAILVGFAQALREGAG